MSPSATPRPSLALERGGAGSPLVLLHGLGLSRRSWRPVRDALEQRHEVIAIDLPGFGESPPLAEQETPAPQRLADLVAEELDRLELTAPAVAGNSLGGWIALELARRGRVSRVVAIAPSGLETPPERVFVIMMNELMRSRARLSAPYARRLTSSPAMRTVLFAPLRSRPWRVTPQAGERDLHEFGCSPGFQPTLRASVGTRAPERLGEIAVPVRIAYGTRDVLLGALTAPRFAALIPGAELISLPGLGHVPMLDDPQQVARTILDFTDSERRPG